MNINKNILLLSFIYLVVILLPSYLLCGELNKAPITIIAIPAICGNNTDRGYSNNILKLVANYHLYKTGTLSLTEKPDFGQTRCINHLAEKMASLKTDQNIIFIATSQGTGTLTNYIAQLRNETYNIKAIIYEGYAASFNQSISYALQSKIPFLKKIPFLEYFLPFLIPYIPYFKGASFPFWHYNPAHEQPFQNIKHLPKNIPIIIVHCRQDRVTPYQGAEVAYYQSVKTGHITYLIPIDRKISSLSKYTDDGHIDVIEKDSLHAQNLNALLDSLLNKKASLFNPARYQPDSQKFLKQTKSLEKKEERIKTISSLLKLTKFFTILIMAWKIKNYLSRKIS